MNWTQGNVNPFVHDRVDYFPFYFDSSFITITLIKNSMLINKSS